jgi:integrase
MESRKLERTKEPGIYKRGSRFVVMYRDGFGRQHKRSGGATIKEAKDIKARLRADVSRGEDTEVTRDTFAVYATRWIEHYAGRTSKGVRDETRADYKRVLERDAVPFLGHLRVAQIRQTHLNELAAHVAARGVTAATVRASLAPVKALLAEALAAGDIRVNPAAGWRARYTQTADVVETSNTDDVKALSEEQLSALLAEVPEDWRLFYAFLLQTGLRISEAIELRWRDVDFGAVRFTVTRRFYRGKVAPPKSKYGRRAIRLTPALAKALWPLQGGPDDLVFTSSNGKRVDQSNVMSRVLKPAAVRAGVGELVKDEKGKLRAETWVGHHTFRHTCATMLFRYGWNAKQVQVWLGHHSPAFTLQTYIHLLPDDLPEPPAAFETLTGGNTGATQATETDRNDVVESVAVSGSMPPDLFVAARSV